MAIYILVYGILIFLSFMVAKGRIPKWCGKKEAKQALTVLILANTIGFILFYWDSQASGMIRDGELLRNAHGMGRRVESLHATVEDELERKPFDVRVDEQQYTREQVEQLLNGLGDLLEELILGENQSLERVEEDLNLITQIPGYSIRVSWELSRYDIMNTYGELQPERLQDQGNIVELRALLSYGEQQAIHIIYAVVYPKEKTTSEQMVERIGMLVEQSNEETRYMEHMALPTQIDGRAILWERESGNRGFIILFLGMVAAIMMVLLHKQKVEQEQRKKYHEMMVDYPEIISKFTLLIGAGMTTKSAWRKIIQDYQRMLERTGRRFAYEEMCYTFHEMQSGISERDSYERMGRRMGLPVYMKFGALLAQNLKKGTKGLTELLSAMSSNAFEDRKNLARQQGEEAGTKLLIPMFLMLMVVLIVVIVPAFMSMNL